MKLSRLSIMFPVIAIIGYTLYFVIGLSSTFPSLGAYHFAASEISFEKKLAARINASNGWSLENTDTVREEKGDACY